MAKNTLSIKYTSEGLKETVQGLSQVGSAFEQALKNAQESVEQAKRNVKAAQGDLSLNIPVNDRALGESKIQLERAQKQLQSVVSNAFGQLGVRSQSSIETQKRQLISAFEAIKQSGVASAGDIANAEAQLIKKLAELDRQLDQTGDSAEDASKQMNQLALAGQKVGEGYTVFKNILANLGTSAIQSAVSSLQQLAGSVISVGAQTEKTAVAFETFLGSAEKAKAVMESVRDFAASTPFELPEVTEAAKQLLAVKIPVDQLIPTIKMLGEIAAGADKPLGQLLFVYTQIKNQGRATAEEINQLTNAGISMADFAQALGIAENQVKELSSKGKIGFAEVDKVLKSMTSEGGRFFGLMDKLGSTTAVKLSNLNDAFTKIYNSIYTGISPALSAVLDIIVQTLDPLGNNQEIWKGLNAQAQEFKEYIAANPAIAKALNEALTQGVKVALQSVTDLAKRLVDYLQQNPTAIADAVKALNGFIEVLKVAVDWAGKLGRALDDAFLGWKQMLSPEKVIADQIEKQFGAERARLYLAEVEREIKSWEAMGKPTWFPGNRENIANSVYQRFMGQTFVEDTPGERAAASWPTAPTAQKFFPVAKGNIGTSPGQKFDAPRMRNGRPGKHNGIDITATQGEPVHAVVGGRITEIRVLDPAVGSHGIFIQGADGNTWTYNHVVPTPGLKVGATVGNGQQIAKVSADDKLSQGAHLDIKVKNAAGNYFDPTSLLSQLPRPTPSNLQRAQSTAQIQPAQPAIATGGTPTGPAKTVKASFYGGPSDPTRWHGRKTASGEVYDENALTVAVPYRSKTDKKPSIPFGTQLAVTNPANGKQVVVRVTDTGNFGTDAQYGGRGLDLSYAAAKALGTVQAGVAPVSYRILGATATTATVSKEQEELEKKQERARVQAEKIREQFRTTTDRQEIAKLKEKHATILEEMTSQKKSEYLIQWQTLQQQNELAELEYKQTLNRLKEQRTEKQKAIKAGLEDIPNADRDLSLDIQTLTADRARERAQFKRQANAINSGELERRQRWDIDNQLEAGKAAIAVARQNLELQRKQLSTALELGSINQENYLTKEKAIIQEESLLKIAENRNEMTRLQTLLEKDLAADTERAGINRQLNALETENKLIQETAKLDLQQIDHRLQQLKIGEAQAKTARELERISASRILAERANRLEEARDLSLAEIDLQYLQQKAAIEAGITDEKERQAELDLAEAQRNQSVRETELNYINQKNAIEAGNQQRANQISDLQAGLEWNPFEASRLQEEAANRNAEADYSASIEDIRQRYGDNFEDNPQAVLEAQDAANILTLTLRQIDRQFLDLSESIGMGLAGAFDNFFQALFRGEDALTAFAQSLASTLADIGQQLISGGIKSALGGIFGFAEGGYTGNGGKYQPAGIVHAGEYVLNQTTTQRLGTKLLDRLNTGQLSGYFAGGLVTENLLLQGLGSNLPNISLPNSPAMATVPVSTTNTVTVNINDQNSRFYTQSRTLARELAEKLRG